MEARLGEALSLAKGKEPVAREEAGKNAAVVEGVAPASDLRMTAESPGSAESPSGRSSLPESETINAWPDAAAEAAFLGEARERGEPVAAVTTGVVEEMADPKDLPSLDQLVKRLSPEVRVALDDLFRAKFTTVRRVPKKVLKS